LHRDSLYPDDQERTAAVHRYLVERTLDSETPNHSRGSHLEFAQSNAREGVTWVLSYVSPDHHKSFCIYDAPSPEAIRSASIRNGLPVDRITEVTAFAAQSQLQPANDLADTIQSRESY
jgi:hypothetical protein